MSSRALSVLMLVLFGCDFSYEGERESMVDRTMPELGACPSEDAVASEERAEDADRTEWRRLDVGALCFYRVTGLRSLARCSETLDDVRTKALEVFAPDYDTAQGKKRIHCADNRWVLVVEADGPTCPEPDAVPEDVTVYEIEELLLSQTRAPYRVCDYEVTHAVTKRPFSCGGGRLGFAP